LDAGVVKCGWEKDADLNLQCRVLAMNKSLSDEKGVYED
jgi:hypothetical protein